jgi:hypothetical protein
MKSNNRVLRPLFWICLALCCLLGVLHIAATFLIFDHLTQRALYFAGTGLAGIILAFFNFATFRQTSADRLSHSLVHVSNGLMALFAVFAVLAVPEPQAYVGGAIFWGLFLTRLFLDRGSSAAEASAAER